ncbi:MAG: hypothetical protein OEZ58_16525 [Gammaproteobacteria bacterium]|nr:hypothetical protein [Gammaproteobacteria bacterium]MDH5730597.1 hypothetical protein [Gammaproteobacteria bacterium]
MAQKNDNIDKQRRSFLKKAVYSAPVIISIPVLPAHASIGSALEHEYEHNDYKQSLRDHKRDRRKKHRD